KILDEIEFGLNRKGALMAGGQLSLPNANIAKQAVGDLGAWLHDPNGKILSDSDRVLEDVANKFYRNLNTEIAAKSAGPVADINKQISDLLPIRAAVLRRIPAEARSSVITMADMLGLAHGSFALSIASRLLGSGRGANLAVKAGQAAPSIGPAIGRGTAGA